MNSEINLKKLLYMFTWMIITCFFIFNNPMDTEVMAAVPTPQVSIVSLDHMPFLEGDKNQFFIATKNYTGKVQYQLFYTCEGTMGNKWQLIQNSNMVNGWTSPSNAQQPITVDISSLNLKADYYRFAIRVKRYGVKGIYSNSYGDYDNAYPFTLNVFKNASVNLNGDIKINKNEFTQKDTLKIAGVQNSAGNLQYILHLYDVKNNKWLTNLTSYTNNIEYSLNKLQPGPYIVDIWAKTKDSNSKYDGWKLSVINVNNETLPKVDLVSLDHSPFIEGDNNAFYVATKNYTGKVQYQFFYNCKTTMADTWQLINTKDMVDGWTKEATANEPLRVDISNLNLKKDFYRFAIRVKRVGVKGTYENKYGDYDNAYPFNLTVEGENSMTLNEDIVINKDIFFKNDQLVITGVTSAPENTQYKLHLYDTQNNKWLTNLTDYSNSIDYDLSNIPEGTYILNTWAKDLNSNKKYDGWKLKVINITSDLITVTDAQDISSTIKRNNPYRLPQSILATMEDGSKKSKAVVWDNEASTKNAGVFEVQGNILGSSKKVKLSLTVEETFGNTNGNIINLGVVAKKDNYIYYSEGCDEGKLYKSDLNGENITKLCDDIAYFINVMGDYIYYCNDSDNSNLYRIKLDGTGRTKLTDRGFYQLIVEDTWIYCIDIQNHNIYKISTDGKIINKLNNDNTKTINVSEDYIYYINKDDNLKLYRITKNGSGKTKINNDASKDINVVDNWIYYINPNDSYKVYKVKTDGTNKTKVLDVASWFLNVASNGRIYSLNLETQYLSMSEDYGKGNNNPLMSTGLYPNVIDDYMYYFTEEYDWIFRIKDDGPQNELFGLYIKAVENINTTIAKSTKYNLPKQINCTTSMNTNITQEITWNINDVDTSNVGQYIFEGTIEGYNKKIKAIVNVVDIAPNN